MNDIDGVTWWRVEPPLLWERACLYIIADSFLPDGTRLHMVKGDVSSVLIGNAIVVGESDIQNPKFALKPSHLSNISENE